MLGCTPKGRNTEQHDIFFTIASSIRDTVPAILAFWPEARGKIHIDAWREVTRVDNFSVEVVAKDEMQYPAGITGPKLFFINLGGYKEGEFDEFHYKMLVAAAEKSLAIQQAKLSAFYQHTGFEGAPSHIDDKFGIDVDDIHAMEDILPEVLKEHFSIRLKTDTDHPEDEIHLGYFKLDAL